MKPQQNSSLDYIKVKSPVEAIEKLRQGSSVLLRVWGSSMTPSIKSAQLIKISPLSNNSDIKPGKIVAVCDNDELTIHRVIKIVRRDGRRSVITKGDNIRETDEPRPIEAVIAIVDEILPGKNKYLPGAMREKMFMRSLTTLSLNKNEYPRIVQQLTRIDWGELWTVACQNGMEGLLYHHLREDALSSIVPSDVLEFYKNAYQKDAISTIYLMEETKKILTVFKSKNIDAAIFKGLALYATIYRETPLRSFGDVDILVSLDDLPKAVETMRTCGYYLPDYYPRPADDDHPIKSIMFEKEGAFTYFIHLHWNTISSTWPAKHIAQRMDSKKILQNALRISLDGMETKTLSLQDCFVTLCVHCLLHGCNKDKLLFDIALFIEKNETKCDWEKISEISRTIRLENSIYALAEHALKNSAIQVKNPLPKPAVISLSDKILSYLILTGWKIKPLYYFLFLFSAPKINDRIDFLKQTIFPDRKIMAINHRIPQEKISLRHYWQRFFKNTLNWRAF